MIAIHIDAGNDRNGNPKRGWIITDDRGDFIDFVDEGYGGRASLGQAGYGDVSGTARIEVPSHVYREFKRDAEKKLDGINRPHSKHR